MSATKPTSRNRGFQKGSSKSRIRLKSTQMPLIHRNPQNLRQISIPEASTKIYKIPSTHFRDDSIFETRL